MPILNYTTRVPAEQTVMEITRLLVKYGATDIITSYGEDGEPRSLKWRLNTPHGPLAFALPCNVPQVFHLLTQDRIQVRDVEARRRQATRVAWRILKDWIEAQLALLDTGMVELEEYSCPTCSRVTRHSTRRCGRAISGPCRVGRLAGSHNGFLW